MKGGSSMKIKAKIWNGLSLEQKLALLYFSAQRSGGLKR